MSLFLRRASRAMCFGLVAAWSLSAPAQEDSPPEPQPPHEAQPPQEATITRWLADDAGKVFRRAQVNLGEDGLGDVFVWDEGTTGAGGAGGGGPSGGGARWAFLALTDDAGGLAVAPADDALRAQLKIADKRGLVVTAVRPESPAAEAGVVVHDVLLLVDDEPLAEPETFTKRIKSGKEVRLKLLRRGEPKQVILMPKKLDVDSAKGQAYRVLLNAVQEAAPYRIGVQISPASETLRSQLALEGELGVVINGFEPEEGTPAQKAGLMVHDVLVQVNDEPLKSEDVLRGAVQGSEGKELTITFLREGDKATVTVKPEKAAQAEGQEGVWQIVPRLQGLDSEAGFELHLEPQLRALRAVEGRRLLLDRAAVVTPQVIQHGDWLRARIQAGAPADAGQKLDEMLKQIESLRESVEALRASIKEEGEKKE